MGRIKNSKGVPTYRMSEELSGINKSSERAGMKEDPAFVDAVIYLVKEWTFLNNGKKAPGKVIKKAYADVNKLFKESGRSRYIRR